MELPPDPTAWVGSNQVSYACEGSSRWICVRAFCQRLGSKCVISKERSSARQIEDAHLNTPSPV